MARVSFVAWLKRVGSAVLWLLLFMVVGLGVTLGLSIATAAGGGMWWLARNGVSQLVGFFVATWLVGRLANRYTWDRMGWRAPRVLPRHFLGGLALGAGMAVVAVLLAVVIDGAALRLTGTAGFLGVAGPLAIGLCAAALSEELIFRGYPLRRLADAIGPGAAIAMLAIGFGASHLGNPEAGVLGTINIALAAVWLAVAFFSTGGMALAWGLHFGWNATLGLGFDAPVSGFAFDVPGMDYFPGTHAWVDGGRFGPEGGVIATLVILGGVAAVLGRRARTPRAWLAEAAA